MPASARDAAEGSYVFQARGVAGRAAVLIPQNPPFELIAAVTAEAFLRTSRRRHQALLDKSAYCTAAKATSGGINMRAADLTIRAMPELLTRQEHFGGRSIRNAAGNVLLRAPLPCFLALSFTIELALGEEVRDAEPIADALATAANGIGFTCGLPASLMHDIIHISLLSRSAIVATDIAGQIRLRWRWHRKASWTAMAV